MISTRRGIIVDAALSRFGSSDRAMNTTLSRSCHKLKLRFENELHAINHS
jgi:hypothetical protein